MKSYFLILIVVLSSSTLFSQDIDGDVFEKYKKDRSVSYINISPKMFEMLGKLSFDVNDPKAKDFVKMVQELDHFKALTSKHVSVAQDMESWLENQLEETALETIMNFSEQGADIQICVIYGNEDAIINRLVMYIKGVQELVSKKGLTLSGVDYVLLSVEGKINLNQVATLAEIVEIPGGEFLKKLN